MSSTSFMRTSRPFIFRSIKARQSVREEIGNRAREILRDRASLMHRRVAEFASSLRITGIELGSNARLPGDYVAGHALGVSYVLTNMPDETVLRADLKSIIRAYRALIYRGGTDADVELQDDVPEEFGLSASLIVAETRKCAFHRKTERNATAAKQAKRFHGTVCQACGFEFGKFYGDIGRGIIEAHHLKPIGALEEGVPVHYDIAADFAVLCSNCHRMIHRSADPSSMAALRALLRSIRA